MSDTFEISPKLKSFKNTLRNRSFWLPLSGTILGATGGFLYYYFIGCQSGSCPITSNPYMSIIWGSSIGFLLFKVSPNK